MRIRKAISGEQRNVFRVGPRIDATSRSTFRHVNGRLAELTIAIRRRHTKPKDRRH
jgi:hypothetical protein